MTPPPPHLPQTGPTVTAQKASACCTPLWPSISRLATPGAAASAHARSSPTAPSYRSWAPCCCWRCTTSCADGRRRLPAPGGGSSPEGPSPSACSTSSSCVCSQMATPVPVWLFSVTTPTSTSTSTGSVPTAWDRGTPTTTTTIRRSRCWRWRSLATGWRRLAGSASSGPWSSTCCTPRDSTVCCRSAELIQPMSPGVTLG